MDLFERPKNYILVDFNKKNQPMSKISLLSALSVPDVENVLVSDDANVLLFHGLQLVSYQGKESF